MAGRSTAYLALAAIAAAAVFASGTAAAQQQNSDETQTEREQQAAAGDGQARIVAPSAVDDDLGERRSELMQNADQALTELREQNSSAAELIDRAYGHAVFNTTKGGLILTGAGGTGIARTRDLSEVTFMRLGSAGIGLGAGFENYRLILLFADEETYRRFISGQWDGSFSAQAAAGVEGVSAEEQFLAGVRAYRLTDGGLMAQVDAAGIRFWPARRLNDAGLVAERVAAAERGPGADADESFATEDASPASSAETLAALRFERNDLGTFIEALEETGLNDALTGDAVYTVFAPTDDAFEASAGMSREELLDPANREMLIRLLRAHIVADDLDSELARSLPQARTIDGDLVALGTDRGRLRVGQASVLDPDLRRGNLRVHVVDGLISEPLQVAAAEPEPDSDAGADEGETAEQPTDAPEQPAESAAPAAPAPGPPPAEPGPP